MMPVVGEPPLEQAGAVEHVGALQADHHPLAWFATAWTARNVGVGHLLYLLRPFITYRPNSPRLGVF